MVTVWSAGFRQKASAADPPQAGPLVFPDVGRHAQPAPFTFAVMGDSRGSSTQINRPVLSRLATDCRQRDPNVAFLVFIGDMVMGSPAPETTAAALDQWRRIIAADFSRPLCPVMGNHDAKSQASQNVARELFSTVPRNGPRDEIPFVYYFDYHRCRFIVLDTNYFGDSYRIRHLEWLETVLKEARAAGIGPIFVFGHTPAYPTGGHLRDSLTNVEHHLLTGNPDYLSHVSQFWSLLTQYRVAAYICGHEHLYTRQDIRGVWQIVSGGAGGPLHKLNPARPSAIATDEERQSYQEAEEYYEHLGYPHGPGEIPQAGTKFKGLGVYHYCLFEVRPDEVTVRVYGAAPVKSSQEMTDIVSVDSFAIVSGPRVVRDSR